MSGNGPNAVDFHIAFQIGRLSAQDPSAFFHIISKDTGFDPLIQHLKERKISATRSKDVADIAILEGTEFNTAFERIDVVLNNLRQRGTSKPRTLKTLMSTMDSLFHKQLPKDELAVIFSGLQKKGFIKVNDTKVTYDLPGDT